MIQVFYTDPKTMGTYECEEGFSGGVNLDNKWVHLTNPTDREIELVARVTGVSEDFLKVALDEEEKARIDEEDGNVLTVFDIPVIEEDDSYYTYDTIPFAFVIAKGVIVSVCLKETAMVQGVINGRMKGFSTAKKTRSLYQLLYFTHTKYIAYLRQIYKASQRIQDVLEKTTKNKGLIQMLELEKSIVYFSTSLRSNNYVLEKLSKTSLIKKYEEDDELLDDVTIENRQALEMCNIYREIINSTMDTWGSIISNNVNSIMKVLTSLTLIVNIPMLISGIWGMNTWVPGEGNALGFWLVCGISGLLSGIIALILRKKKLL